MNKRETKIEALQIATVVKEYIYIGDRFTDPALKDKPCKAVKRNNGKCIRGRNGNMLVEFEGVQCNILAKRLRLKK